MADGKGWEGARGLIVEDDANVREYVSTILLKSGIHVDLAVDGMEGEARLRETAYELLFLDLDLPAFSGKFILELLKRGKVQRPNWTVVMSGAPNISHKLGDDWTRLGVAEFLPKPFSAADLQALLDRLLRAIKDDAKGPKGPVLLIGLGNWAEVLSGAVTKGGGTLLTTASSKGVAEALEKKPGVAVLGPPLSDADIIQILVSIPEAKRAGLQLLVATDRPAENLRADLLTLGAVRTVALPVGLAWLSDEVARLAGLKPPPRRTPFTHPVLMRTPHNIYTGKAVELFEGGLTANFRITDQPTPPLVVEFELPGENKFIEASANMAWNQPLPDDMTQVGLQFTGMSEQDLERIRNFVLVNDASQ